MIRFQRTGRRNDPAFRIVVLEKERAAKAGNVVELLGTYNPKSKVATINGERVKEWLAKGAQATDSVHNLLIDKGVLSGKKVNVIPSKVLENKVIAETPRTEKAPAETPATEQTEEAAAE